MSSIRITSGLPPIHPIELVFREWAEKIQTKTNGGVQFAFYDTSGSLLTGIGNWTNWVKQLGNDYDISHGITMMPESPLSIGRDLSAFTYGTDTSGAGKVYNRLLEKFPEMCAEYSGMKFLFGFANPESWLQTKIKPIRSLDDIKTLRYLSFGIFSEVFGKLGGISVTAPISPMMGIYPAIADGRIDGSIELLGILTEANGKGMDVIRYATNLHLPMPPGDFFAMNLNTWNSLPSDIKQVFEDSFSQIQTEMENTAVAVEQAVLNLAKAKGIEFIELSPKDLNKFYSIMEEIAIGKAAELDAQGLPGTRIFKEARRLIEGNIK